MNEEKKDGNNSLAQDSIIMPGNLNVEDIVSITLSSYKGDGKESEITELNSDKIALFVEIYNMTELSELNEEKEYASSGAASTYFIKLKDSYKNMEMVVCPGKDFFINHFCYEMMNFDEIWDRWIIVNSVRN
ncbi:MAG: hypothetical protein J6M24_06680 [Lachnospiraceae bacterium]|nr:hypothetical protein [Lachnospiraceae bacterium]